MILQYQVALPANPTSPLQEFAFISPSYLLTLLPLLNLLWREVPSPTRQDTVEALCDLVENYQFGK